MSNYDIAVSMDGVTLNRVVATLFDRPGLKTKLFSGSETINMSGADVTVGWEVLHAPVLSLIPPTPEQWASSIKKDGQTTPQPIENAFTVKFQQLKVTRTKTTGATDKAIIPVVAICSISVKNNILAIDPVAVVVDVTQAAKLDQILYKKVIVPQVLKLADTLLTDEQIPNFKFQGVKFGEVVVVVGNGRITGVANLDSKPAPSSISTADLPDGAFYILLSQETLQQVTSVGTQALTGRTIDKSGSQGFEIGTANYDTSVRIDSVSGVNIASDFTEVTTDIALSISASAGISAADLLAYQAKRAAEIAAAETQRAAEEAAAQAKRAAEETQRAAEKAAEEARRVAEEQARLVAEAAEQARRAAEEQAKRAAEEAQRAAEEQARRVAEAAEQAKREAEEQARRAAEVAAQAQREAEEQARRAAEAAEQARRAAEEQARRAAEEAQRAAERAADEARRAAERAADEAKRAAETVGDTISSY